MIFGTIGHRINITQITNWQMIDRKTWIFSCEFHMDYMSFIHVTRTICIVRWPNFCLQCINTQQLVEAQSKYECAYVMSTRLQNVARIFRWAMLGSVKKSYIFFVRSQLPDTVNSRQFWNKRIHFFKSTPFFFFDAAPISPM